MRECPAEESRLMKWLSIGGAGRLSLAVALLLGTGRAQAQEAGGSGTAMSGSKTEQGTPAGAPLRLTLQDALARARKNSVPFQAALTDSAIARQDRYQAAAALLPSVNYNNEALYTQSSQNGIIKFIANNAPHEYVSQGNVHESLDLASVAAFRRAAALAAAAKARAEVASRGLVVTVVQDYYAVAAAQQKVLSAQ